jgi:hypothetical protein
LSRVEMEIGGGGVGHSKESSRLNVGDCLMAGDQIALRSVERGELLVVRESEEEVGSRDDARLVLSTAPEGDVTSEAATWQVVAAGMPFVPAWATQRLYLAGAFLLAPQRGLQRLRTVSEIFGVSAPLCGRQRLHNDRSIEYLPLRALPVAVQEQLLLDDVMAVLLGFEGKYVRVAALDQPGDGGGVMRGQRKESAALLSSLRFEFDASAVDRSLVSLCENLLPLGEAYLVVKGFVATRRSMHECGMVRRYLPLSPSLCSLRFLLCRSFLIDRLSAICVASITPPFYYLQPTDLRAGILNKVAHALAAGLQVLLNEYMVLVAQLEHHLRAEALTLQKLWFFMQPAIKTMLLLQGVAEEARSAKGGALLNVLHVMRESQGVVDDRSHETLRFLLARAAVPYLGMLRRWILEGMLEDPYREFMVAEEEVISKEGVIEDFQGHGAYWERRYTLQHDMVATFLERYEEKVLTTGKYLNVVRECGDGRLEKMVTNNDTNLHGSRFAGIASGKFDAVLHNGMLLSEADYGDIIDRAYAIAGSTLQRLLMSEHRLIDRLRSIKHYFLLDQGDLYVNFMDLAEEELANEITEKTRLYMEARVDALLSLAVSQSVSNLDPFKDDLVVDFAKLSMLQHLDNIHSGSLSRPSSSSGRHEGEPLRGVAAFMLDYKVRWPVSLVVSRRSLDKYQLIFRQLFFVRHVERSLKSTWKGHQNMKELDVRAAAGKTFCLRHRMLGFMQNMVYYMTNEVIEPRWHDMESKLRACRTMDEVLHHHTELLNTVLKECLLTEKELLKTLNKIMTICPLFADQVRVSGYTR